MAAKHSLKARRGELSEASLSILRRVRVPISESWAAVYLELQSRNEHVLINARRRIFVSNAQLEDTQTPTALSALISRWKPNESLLKYLRAGAVLAPCLFVGLLLFGEHEPKPANVLPPTPHALTTQASASKKCVSDEAGATSKALSANSWQKLGGVGYAVVTLNCGASAKGYLVVKNLVTGGIASVKSVG